MNTRQTLAIIGSGPSCIYVLKNILDRAESFKKHLVSIDIFEKRRVAGMGMPYNPETTARENMCNITSEEIPALLVPFVDWLKELDATHLAEFDIQPEEISDKEVYSRLALGEYFHAQYQSIVASLSNAGIAVLERAHCTIVDIIEKKDAAIVVDKEGKQFSFDHVVVATGHYWPEKDHPSAGYYQSPWPISKLLPSPGEFYNFKVGTLGASLSAFDVVSSLARRHGVFEECDTGLAYRPSPGTEGFKIAMHSSKGLLPHLQYGQKEPMREIERYVSVDGLMALRDNQGFLRLHTYFDSVCRPVLIEAFHKDSLPDLVELLESPSFSIEDFAQKMTDKHDYPDAFVGMKTELEETIKLERKRKPSYWKEALDDLMYTLNFHAELMPAEDHLVLHSKILPFVMNVIAAMPILSARMLLALHDSGKLEIVPGMAEIDNPEEGATSTRVAVKNDDKEYSIEYRMFIDCSGQGSLEPANFPFPSLAFSEIREARAFFTNDYDAREITEGDSNTRVEGKRYLSAIGGVDIDRNYRLIGSDGLPSTRIADIAFPHTTGIRPYSYGLQACNDTARFYVEGFLADLLSSGAVPINLAR
jgi:hypothetical protein